MGKEQILGKLGIADSTFDFIRAMVATGFNEEVIMGMLAQPIVKIYLSQVQVIKLNLELNKLLTLLKENNFSRKY
jgi:hypothetical protein